MLREALVLIPTTQNVASDNSFFVFLSSFPLHSLLLRGLEAFYSFLHDGFVSGCPRHTK